MDDDPLLKKYEKKLEIHTSSAWGFLRRKLYEFSERSTMFLYRKNRTKRIQIIRFLYFFETIVFIPFVILVRIIKPFVVIRFGQLVSSRIGHFALNTELYLCYQEKYRKSTKNCDFLYLQYPISNQQLLKMSKRCLNIYGFVRGIDFANKFLPGGSSHIIEFPSDRDLYLLSSTNPHLYLTLSEKKKGYSFLKKLNIKDKEYICFHVRDPMYLRRLVLTLRRTIHPSKLTSRRHDYRNSDIVNCLPAMERLAEMKYHIFRMGDAVEKELISQNTRIIDYANNGMRSEFLDIFLSVNCRYFVSASSGMNAIPIIFGVPLLVINLIPLEYIPFNQEETIFIPKKLWFIDEHRFMKFGEIFESGAGRFLHTEQHEKMGVEVIENTPEEIRDAVLEMEARLNGTWEEEKENDELQRQFWEIFPRSELHGKIRSRIGADFLRHYSELLA